MVETLSTALFDQFESLRSRKPLVVGSVCFGLFLAGLTMCLQGGIYMFELFNWYSAGLSVIILAITEIVVVQYIYGEPSSSGPCLLLFFVNLCFKQEGYLVEDFERERLRKCAYKRTHTYFYYTLTYTHTDTYMYIFTYISTHIYMCVYTCVYMYVYTCLHAYINRYTPTGISITNQTASNTDFPGCNQHFFLSRQVSEIS